jgi:hypothetical protein
VVGVLRAGQKTGMDSSVSAARPARLGRRRRWSIRLWVLSLAVFYSGFLIDLLSGGLTGRSLALLVTSAVLLTAAAVTGVWLTLRHSRQT